ncbi:MAG: YegP family protein [Acidobacteriota bacterium]
MGAVFEKFKGKDSKYYFRYRGAADAIILRSEAYVGSSGRDGGIQSVKSNAQRDAAYEKLKTSDDRYYFRLKATNGEIVATSVFYASDDDRQAAIDDVWTYAPSAPVEDE